ncbi:MAG: signal peptidase I [Treponema sp.]|nr:signal peptidase I [Treponema sp.]
MNKQLFEYSYALKKEKKQRTFLIVLYVLLIAVIINLILTYIIFPVRQVSNSMAPDVDKNTVFFVTPLVNEIDRRGDIVLIKPNQKRELTFTQKALEKLCLFFTGQQFNFLENKDFPGTKASIRRVIGLPGDTVYMRDYVLYIKPEGEKHFLTEFELIKKPYNVTLYTAPAEWDGSLGVKGSFDEIVLGENEYFVLGDNRKSSCDSRLWGPVAQKNIKGRVLISYFPFNKIKIY